MALFVVLPAVADSRDKDERDSKAEDRYADRRAPIAIVAQADGHREQRSDAKRPPPDPQPADLLARRKRLRRITAARGMGPSPFFEPALCVIVRSERPYRGQNAVQPGLRALRDGSLDNTAPQVGDPHRSSVLEHHLCPPDRPRDQPRPVGNAMRGEMQLLDIVRLDVTRAPYGPQSHRPGINVIAQAPTAWSKPQDRKQHQAGPEDIDDIPTGPG